SLSKAGLHTDAIRSVGLGWKPKKAAENSPKNSRIEPLNLENVQVLSNQRTNFKVHGEDCRSPKRKRGTGAGLEDRRFWSAAALCRFFRLPAKTDTFNRPPPSGLTSHDGWRRISPVDSYYEERES